MAKKKTGRQFMESNEARIVSEEFDRAVKIIKKQPMKGRAAKHYDLHGEVLRRRKAVTLAYMEQIKDHYAQKHTGLDVVTEWALHSSITTQSVAQTDHENHITLAAAIWMLDELKHSGHLKDAFKYFYKEAEALETFYLPDFFDAWHDDSVIRGMMYLIRHRDNCDDPERHYINDTTASRTVQIDYSEVSQPDEEQYTAESNLGPRERFNAIMAMIHPEVRRRAIDRFESKQWEFLDGLFACGEIYSEEEDAAILEIEKLLTQGQGLQKRLDDERKRASGITAKPLFPVAAANPIPIPSFQGIAATDFPTLPFGMGSNDTISKLRRIAETGLAFQNKADDLRRQHADLQFLSPIASLYGRKALERDLRPEIVDRLLSFEVNDPYETCFAFLCLIEEGADAAWLYNTNLAVLSAAARKLPWANNILTREDYELPEGDEEETDAEDEVDDTVEPAETPASPLDWNHKKAQLYELKYKDDLEFFPEKSNRKDWKLNIPQMVYTLTGLVMPRTVSDYDELAGEFVEAGMDPSAASILELYLQLASDVQYPSKDWEAFLQSSRFQRINELYGEEEPDSDEDAGDDVDVEALRDQIRTLKEKNDELRQMLYTATKEAENQREETKRVLDETANEHQELLDLRELIYNQANNQNQAETEAEDQSVELPYHATQRVVVFGGHDTWLKAIKPLLPNVVFVNREQNPNAEIIRAADAVWIQANALSHKNYYKIINIVRTYRIPVRYFGYASARKCAEQLVHEDMKA